MPKKIKTQTEKNAWGAKMQAARVAKRDAQVERENDKLVPPIVTEPVAPIQPNQPDYAELQRQVLELTTKFANLQPQGPQVANGRLVGTFTKYNTDPNYYPDPCERLAAEPRLQRFAFPMNYELKFTTSTSSYETKDGISTVEPKFELELVRIMLNEETGEATNKRYVICKAIFHEDPQSAIVVARQNGIDINKFNEKDFLDEMRYLQMRDWVLECFYPPKTQEKEKRKEMVIDGKIVQYFEINSETPEAMKFGDLKGRV